jgi:hypothetical protein
MCCETTARVGANLGFEMSFAIDATHTFDLDDHEGCTIAADELAWVTAQLAHERFPPSAHLSQPAHGHRETREPQHKESGTRRAPLSSRGRGEGAAPERVCIYIHHRHTILQF